MKTVLEVIQATTAYFEKNDVENPRLNAEHLLAGALGCKRMELYLMFDRTLSEEQLAPLRETVRKRAAGHPLQHLLGTVEFHGAEYLTDPRALIPRPETEQLVALLIQRAATPPARVADVGTGSGVIACSLARQYPEAQVEAFDISPEALSLATANKEKLGLAGQVRFCESDLLHAVPGPFDWIVANLPYIETQAIPGLSREVRHDPVTALDGGPDGLDLIRRLIPQAAEKLNPGGLLALEIGAGQDGGVVGLLEQAGFHGVEALSDHQDIPRFIIGFHG